MLRVTVDLVPFGFEDRKRSIFTIEIANVGTRGIKIADDGKRLYSYRVRTIDEFGNTVDHGVLVRNFDRNQPVYKLISKVMEKL